MEPRDLSDNREYVPGRGADEVAKERGIDPADIISLASNENALGPAPAAVEAVREHADRIHRYPKGSHLDLVDDLAEEWGLTGRQVWLANGGDGALDYLSRAVLDPGDTVLVPEPGFAYYGMSARYHHGSVRTYQLSRERGFAMDAETVLEGYSDERVIYLTTPHNPTGASIPLEQIERIADETANETLVVVDEAYGRFADTKSGVELVRERDDVAVLRSFSKAYGLAGLRLGYALVPEAWAAAYAKVNTPFAASDLACRAGQAALTDTTHLERTIDLVEWGRDYLHESLNAETWPSGGNFVLAEVGDAQVVTNDLLDRGVIVRDCGSFGLPSCIRITIGTKPDLRQAVKACNDVIDG